MRLKLNGKKYKYFTEYFKLEDDFKVKPPSYMTSCCGKVYHEEKWKDCIFFIADFSGKMKIFVSPRSSFRNGISDIGEVDAQGFADIFIISGYKRFLIRTYNALFITKLVILSLIDRARLIKKNLMYISIAVIGSVIYFLINHFYDGYLQKLINESNLVQSIIVFLSLSSVINIFHPFSLRKSWEIKEIDELINKRQAKLKEDIKKPI